MPALYMSKRSGLCLSHAAEPAASATGPNSLRKSGASSLGIRNSSGGAYLGSMMVSSGAKFMPVRKHAHAPRSISLNLGFGRRDIAGLAVRQHQVVRLDAAVHEPSAMDGVQVFEQLLQGGLRHLELDGGVAA